jgi:hypothetical protein
VEGVGAVFHRGVGHFCVCLAFLSHVGDHSRICHIRTEVEINREFDLQILQKEDTFSTKHLAWAHEEDYVSEKLEMDHSRLHLNVSEVHDRSSATRPFFIDICTKSCTVF